MKMLNVVTVQQSNASILKGFEVKLGENLCASCHKILFKIQGNDDRDNAHFKQNDNSEFKELQKEEAINSLNTTLTK